MVQSKKQLENDFVYWMDKSQEYSNAIRKLSSVREAAIGNKSLSPGQTGDVIAERKRLQRLKADADLSAKEIQRKISAFSNSNNK